MTQLEGEISPFDAMSFHRDQPVSVEICMISSPDGVIDVNGKSGPLGSETDRNVLLALREHADVVLVGAGTVRSRITVLPLERHYRLLWCLKASNSTFLLPVFLRMGHGGHNTRWAPIACAHISRR